MKMKSRRYINDKFESDQHTQFNLRALIFTKKTNLGRERQKKKICMVF